MHWPSWSRLLGQSKIFYSFFHGLFFDVFYSFHHGQLLLVLFMDISYPFFHGHFYSFFHGIFFIHSLRMRKWMSIGKHNHSYVHADDAGLGLFILILAAYYCCEKFLFGAGCWNGDVAGPASAYCRSCILLFRTNSDSPLHGDDQNEWYSISSRSFEISVSRPFWFPMWLGSVGSSSVRQTNRQTENKVGETR